MPTAGRLAAAIAFTALGWYLSQLAAPFFPEGNPPDYLATACGSIGFICGWVVCGSRLGNGYIAATGHGLTAGFAFGFWVIFFESFIDMIRKSLRRTYDGPVEAVVDIGDLMLRMGSDLAQYTLITTLLGGGIISAWAAEYVAKRAN